MSKHCCDRMDFDLDQRCDIHPQRHECPDNIVDIVRGGYGLIVHDGGSSVIESHTVRGAGQSCPQSQTLILVTILILTTIHLTQRQMFPAFES